MNSPSLTPAQMEALLRYAAGRLGVSPEALGRTVQEQGAEGLAASLTPGEQQKLSALLGDRSRAEALLASPEARALLRRLSGQ